MLSVVATFMSVTYVKAEVDPTTQEYANYVYNANEEIIIDMYFVGFFEDANVIQLRCNLGIGG